jgi:hypothetical protein
MVSKPIFIAWIKAILHAILIPAALYAFAPFGWLLALAYLIVTTWIYARLLTNELAGYYFGALMLLVALLVIPALLADRMFESTAAYYDHLDRIGAVR